MTQRTPSNNPFFARLWTMLSATSPSRCGGCGRRTWPGCPAGCWRSVRARARTSSSIPHGDRGGRRRARAAAGGAGRAGGRNGAGARHRQHRHRGAVLRTGEPFDAVVCSLVLCSVDDPDSVLRQLLSLLRPGGELRYLEHVASSGPAARLQKLADATVWPRMLGNCHTHATPSSRSSTPGSRSSGAARVGVARVLPMPVAETRSAGPSSRPDALAEQRGQPLQQAGQRTCGGFPQRDRRAVRQRRALGIDLDDTVPLASASSGSPAAG